MAGDSGFGVLLGRLSARRNLDIGALSRLAGVAESELAAVFDGVPPSPSLLRRLAPALGLHAGDLFAIAAVPVPDDLTPVDPNAGRWVPRLVRDALSLAPRQRGELRHRVASLPQQERPARPPRAHPHDPAGFAPGAVVLRLLGNRNLGWTDIARMSADVTGRYWSAATYGQVGMGREPLTPDLLIDFSTLLDIPVDDLAALAGSTPVGEPPAALGVAELIWDVRRLTADQVEHVHHIAESMR
ncbi:MAG TPA: hypothetical protein VFW65_16205 [Pseudonocardiaceae bacterium]|nr:hypothetical protein [Pseudonocardiaceae bacterium]